MRSERNIYEKALILAVIFAMMAFISVEGTSAATIYVPDDYLTIQQAVNNAMECDVITVRDGTYVENVNVNKRLTIRSENGSESTIVVADDSNEYIFSVTAEYTKIDGFSVNGATGWLKAGIYLNASHCHISDNTVSNCSNGIFLLSADNNTVENVCGNKIINITCRNTTFYGIRIENAIETELRNNTCEDNGLSGIRLESSSNNTIVENICDLYLRDSSWNLIANNTCRGVIQVIQLEDSSHNTILNNTCGVNGFGISLSSGDENIISGNTIEGSAGSGCGIALCGNDNMVGENTIEAFGKGIYIEGSNNTISCNEICDCIIGIDTSRFGGEGNKILNNICDTSYGFILRDAPNSTITENRINSTYDSIHLWYSPNSRIMNNTMKGRGLFIQFADWADDTEAYGNIVNGKPVVFWKAVNDRAVSQAPSQVILMRCRNVTVKDWDLSNVLVGVQLLWSSRCTIENITSENESYYGIYLVGSSNNLIKRNRCSNNGDAVTFLPEGDGIKLYNSSNNIILRNRCSQNKDEGIDIWSHSSNNTLSGNEICDNLDGSVDLYISPNNTIYLNNFTNNTPNAHSCASDYNIWNSPVKINYTYDGNTYMNYTGNYWDDYTGTDADGDGIGDTSYRIDGDRDKYPLVEPSEFYPAPAENIFNQLFTFVKENRIKK